MTEDTIGGTMPASPDPVLTEPPMPANDRVQIRRSAELARKIDELAARWGPVKPLSVSDVVRVAIDRAHAVEFPDGEKPAGKKSAKKPR